jgi:hypothetical protein
MALTGCPVLRRYPESSTTTLLLPKWAHNEANLLSRCSVLGVADALYLPLRQRSGHRLRVLGGEYLSFTQWHVMRSRA